MGSSLGELRTVQQAELLAQLEAVSRELKQLEVSKEQILAVVAQVYGTEKEDTQHDHV